MLLLFVVNKTFVSDLQKSQTIMIPLNSKEGVKVSIIKLCRGVIDDIIEKVSSCDDNDTKDFETKPSSVQQQVGVWYQEESLGKGWRTCLISNNGGNIDGYD